MPEYKNEMDMPNLDTNQEGDVFLDMLKNKTHNKLLATSENIPYPVAGIKADPALSPFIHTLRRCGVTVRAHAGRYILFDATKATELLKELGAIHDGKVLLNDVVHINQIDFDNPVQAKVTAQKLQKEGVPVKVTTNLDGKKKVYSLNYYASAENTSTVYKIATQVRVSDFKNERWTREFVQKSGIEGEFDYFVLDTPKEAQHVKDMMRYANVKFASHGSTIVCYDKTKADDFLKQMGLQNDKSVWKNFQIHLCDYDINPSLYDKFRTEAELQTRELNALGVKAVQRDTSVMYLDAPEAGPYFEQRHIEIDKQRAIDAEARKVQRENLTRQSFADDILTKYSMNDFEPLINDLLEPSASEQATSKMKDLIKQAGKKATKATEALVEGVYGVNNAIHTVKQGAVDKISNIKGGKSVLQAGRFVGKVAKVGGAASIAVVPAFDPKGTKEFIDDVTELRFQKIIEETLEGGVQIVLHPKETAEALYEVSKEAVQERYEGAHTSQAYMTKTIEAGEDGLINIAETLTYLGEKEFNMGKGINKGIVNASNWMLEKLDLDTRLVEGAMSYDTYRKDPLAYVSGIVRPITKSASTGLRSDDTVYTVIERGDAKAMQALIERGDDVTKNIQGDYKDLNHNTHYTPYDTALGMAVAKGNMAVAFVLYKEGKNNINGVNGLTKDTTFMSILKQLAPEEGTKEYYLGNGSIRRYTEKERNKHLLGQALVDDMIKSGKLDVTQENAQGKNAFLVAVETGNMAAVDALIEQGVDIQKTAKDGSNALHLCVHNQLMTRALIQHGVDTNQVNQSGKTPLMVALEQGQNKVALNELLLASDAKGIDILMKSEKHATLLNDHLEKQPNLKLAILTSKNHPLKEGLLNSSDKNGNQMSNEALAQETGDKKAPDVVQTLAQSGASVQEQGETISFIQRDIKQVG